jgi:light-regulated signal transduction histidine kinase (bacteriophytochrome)
MIVVFLIETNESNLTDTHQIGPKNSTASLSPHKPENTSPDNSYDELKEIYSFLSHDLKAPLRTATSFLKLFEEKNKTLFDDESKKLLEFSFTSLTKMQDYIRDVSLLAQVEKTFHSTPLEQFKLEDAITAAKKNFHTIIIEKEVEFIVQNNLPSIHANRLLIVQLFSNLFSNAIKFHSDKKLVINVDTIVNSDDSITVFVRDNGIGIDPKFHSIVFELFRRLHASNEYPGTGVGLAICRKITYLHGGLIGVSLDSESGCNFHFTLPHQSY